MTATLPNDNVSVTSKQQLFTKCCFCVPLKVGCFILGYLALIINILRVTNLLLVVTFIGIYTSTNDFKHGDLESENVVDEQVEAETRSETLDYLYQINALLIIILIANIAWLILNIACLVALHKKRPGPIKVYVGSALARWLVSAAVFIHLLMTVGSDAKNVICHVIELGVAGYFILVYYVYAFQLERELKENQRSEPAIDNNAFIYPTKIDKQLLVA